MVKHLFRLKKPLTFQGETFMPGDETKLRMMGFDTPQFRIAINQDVIEPAMDHVKWYKGPYFAYLQDCALFTEHEVYQAVVIEERKLLQIGTKRAEEIKKYFEPQDLD